MLKEVKMAFSKVDNNELRRIRDELINSNPSNKIRAKDIQQYISQKHNYQMDVSTIRGRFIEMGEPLSGRSAPQPPKQENTGKWQPANKTLARDVALKDKEYAVPDELKKYIPKADRFVGYLERGIDKRLALHYDSGKHPITQGKQGTGKTFSHEYYAFKKQLPYFEISCHEDFELRKLFGDKTIENGNIIFREGTFVQALQNPSVILFDEVNAIGNKKSFPFHALLASGKLFVKDADNGQGKWYHKHPDCRIGFAQNPKSAKYLGGNVKPSNFLGRCTFITYPEFTKADIRKVVAKKFPDLSHEEIKNFTAFYFACVQAIERGQIPVDISIRQLNSIIELYLAGLPLRESIEDGLSSMMEAASQPQNKDAFFRLAQGVWKELLDEDKCNEISRTKGFARILWFW
jgi:hypothetical protein